jgi:zinc/manganese transport system substrate-binding protein
MRSLALLLSAAALAAAAGCGSEEAAADDGVQVVASTNVYCDLARTVGGDRVQVTSVIDDPSADPHSYEASVRTQLAVSEADLVIDNGGGYDDFMATLLSATDAHPTLLTAVEVAGLDADAEGFNEHVWYDLPTVDRVADAVSAVLQRKDPAHRADFRAALARFHAATAALARAESGIRRLGDGRGVAVTEPVPLYVTAACGLVNRTPAAFSSAVEDGRDVPPGVLQLQLELVASHAVAVLAVNEQTEGAVTDRIVAAARAARVPVVGFRETLPDGESYLGMFHAELTALRAAVSR